MLLAGRIGKPHGISGEVYVERISDDPARFAAGSRLVHSDGRRLVVESSRSHRTRFLVKFAGIDDRSAAEQLRGAIYVGTDEVRDLNAGEFWEHELIGCAVVDVRGRELGRVEGVIPGPAQDLLSISTARGERMVPLVGDIVVGVDIEARRVRIDPPEGLLE
jgi:16S rRNA processing protein RimM